MDCWDGKVVVRVKAGCDISCLSGLERGQFSKQTANGDIPELRSRFEGAQRAMLYIKCRAAALDSHGIDIDSRPRSAKSEFALFAR